MRDREASGDGGENGGKRDDAPRHEEDASEQAKAKARAAAGDHERGLAPAPEVPPAEQADGSPLPSGETSRGVKGDSAK
jgi:hypothetical protein